MGLVLSLLLGLISFASVGHASATTPATNCWVEIGNGFAQACSEALSKGDKDINGNTVNFSKCYTVSQQGTATPLSCSDSRLTDPKSAEKAQCAANGGTWQNGKCVGEQSPGQSEPLPNGDVCGGNVNRGGKTHEYAAVHTDINFGCKGKGNAIMDLTFAIVRFLSTGVGFVLVASMIWAGIQYTSSRGDPQATAKAIQRIRANVIALLLFIFAYAILNFVVPGAVLG